MRLTSRLKIIIVAVGLGFVWIQYSTVVYAQSISNSIDSLLITKYKPEESGTVFFSRKKWECIYKKAFGIANLELNSPMKTTSVFEIESMTK